MTAVPNAERAFGEARLQSTIVALANKTARIAWALLARNEGLCGRMIVAHLR